MKYSLDLTIYSENQGLLDSIVTLFPSQQDGRVWDVEYNAPTQRINMDGLTVLNAVVRFHASADRDDVTQAITDLTGIFVTCDVGSTIQLHTCYHDETPKSCEVTTVYEVVA